jgi:hypothetical protein
MAVARSADCQSAVSQVANLRRLALVPAHREEAPFADYQSAIQQVNNLRHGRAAASRLQSDEQIDRTFLSWTRTQNDEKKCKMTSNKY